MRVTRSKVIKLGNAVSSARTSGAWKTAQSSIFATISPVMTYALEVKAMYQSVRELDQSKDPLQSVLVENTASHLNESAMPSLRYTPTELP